MLYNILGSKDIYIKDINMVGEQETAPFSCVTILFPHTVGDDEWLWLWLHTHNLVMSHM